MKKMKCYDCDMQFEGETKEEILNHLYDHYMKNHNEIITNADEAEKNAGWNNLKKIG